MTPADKTDKLVPLEVPAWIRDAAAEVAHHFMSYTKPRYVEEATAIIARHYAPLTQAALQAERALGALLDDIPIVGCENFHHQKIDRHGWGVSCPVCNRFNTAVTSAKAALAGIRLALGK